MLTSETAIEIDNYMLGKDNKNEAAKYLSQLLSETTQGENLKALLPGNFGILSNAISSREHFQEYWKGKDTSDLTFQINLVAKDLGDFKNLRKGQQISLLEFCCNLTKEILIHRNKYYSRSSRLVA